VAIFISVPDPSVYPSIVPNYLSDSIDQQVAVAELKWGRQDRGTAGAGAVCCERRSCRAIWPERCGLLEYARGAGTTIIIRSGPARWDTLAPGGRSATARAWRRSLRVVDASIMPRLVSATPTRHDHGGGEKLRHDLGKAAPAWAGRLTVSAA